METSSLRSLQSQLKTLAELVEIQGLEIKELRACLNIQMEINQSLASKAAADYLLTEVEPGVFEHSDGTECQGICLTCEVESGAFDHIEEEEIL